MLPANHEMTSVYFGITKVQCQKLNIIGYFFSFSYMSMHDLLKRKICKEKKKQKESKCFKYGCKHVSRRCGSYRMYLEDDSLMIVCECILLGSKDLGFMYLESYCVLLANHDQNNVFKLF